MRVVVVTPASSGSLTGNRRTADRCADLLRELGHEPEVTESWTGRECDLLLALHARRSAGSVERYRHRRPDGPLVVMLTGTDLYRDLPESAEALGSLEHADLLVGLHDLVADDVPEPFRHKVRVIRQSAVPLDDPPPVERERFRVCLLAHVRSVKDPLLAARAARLLPPSSRVEVVHAGGVLERETGRAVRRESDDNPRYRWLGELSHREAKELLATSRLLLVTSRLEGGANVVSEAVVQGVPVLSTRIRGTEGILGEDYPGLFAVGDEGALADLLHDAESDGELYRRLRRRCAAVRPLLTPDRERQGWRELLQEVRAERGR